MKLPQKPLDWAQIHNKIAPERRVEIHRASSPWILGDKYLHWNDLRRRPAPAGFIHEEWWYAIKFARSSNHRPVDLVDYKNLRSFRFGQPLQLAEILHQIDRGLGSVVGLPAALAEPSARDRYVLNTLIEESITSSQLEGAATTRLVAKEMLKTGRKPRDKSERMILNNYQTMNRIRDLKDVDLTPELILEIHRRITEDTLDKPEAEGRLRRADEDVRVMDSIEGTEYHVPPPADQLPARLIALCHFANGTAPDYFVHPVIRGIILHFWLAYDHPFYDGNGRTARALFYWSMLRQKYELFEFISISEILLRAPVKYAEAFLHTETDDNDLTYFILHQADVIREAVNSLGLYLRRKADELRTAGKCLQGISDLNHRQQALLVHALREPTATYLIAGHQRSHAVTHQTARDDLFDLVERGLLVVHRQGRVYRFRIPSDLSDKLSKLAGAEPKVQEDNSLPLGMVSSTPEA